MSTQLVISVRAGGKSPAGIGPCRGPNKYVKKNDVQCLKTVIIIYIICIYFILYIVRVLADFSKSTNGKPPYIYIYIYIYIYQRSFPLSAEAAHKKHAKRFFSFYNFSSNCNENALPFCAKIHHFLLPQTGLALRARFVDHLGRPPAVTVRHTAPVVPSNLSFHNPKPAQACDGERNVVEMVHQMAFQLQTACSSHMNGSFWERWGTPWDAPGTLWKPSSAFLGVLGCSKALRDDLPAKPCN